MPARRQNVSFLRRLRAGGYGVCLLTVAAFGYAAGAVTARAQDFGPGTAAQAIDARAYEQLEKAHAALTSGDVAAAEEILAVLQKAPLNDYERALVYQAYGYLHASLGQHLIAAGYFERCLALDAMPVELRQGLVYTLAGLYSAAGQHAEVVKTLTRWFGDKPPPAAGAAMLLAGAYIELNRYDEARTWARRAIAQRQDPPEDWLRLLVATEFEMNDFASATVTLRRLVARYPDRASYWEMLAGAYQHSGDHVAAMATMRLAWRRGLLDSESEILDLARLMMFVADPYQAAKLLDAEMSAGRVMRTRENLDLLLGAWLQAQEIEAGIAVIDRLAPMTGDGQYYLQKAQLYAARTNWAEVIPAAEQAIARGGLERPGMPWLLKGMAESELGRYADALDSLQQARAFGDHTRHQAEGWIQFINDRLQMAATTPP